MLQAEQVELGQQGLHHCGSFASLLSSPHTSTSPHARPVTASQVRGMSAVLILLAIVVSCVCVLPGSCSFYFEFQELVEVC